MFEQAGLPRAERIEKVPNSRRALILGELARDRGVFADLHPRLFDAYWARGLDLGDDSVLVAEGEAAGLDRAEITAGLANPSYLQRVLKETREAVELGVTGVPAWVIDGRLLIPGAQPHELFAQALERLGHAPLAAAEG